MQKAQKIFEDMHPRRAVDEDLQNLATKFAFPVPILLGDESLIEDFLADMGLQLRKHSKLAACGLRLHHVGFVLFRLVVLRVYLRRPPANDLDIFNLVKQNQVSRVWTSHEQALAACHGEDDTGPHSKLPQPPTPELYMLPVINDNELDISDDEPLVAIQVPELVTWSNGPALSGGVHKPRRYTPPHLRPKANGPRPKPRPAYKKAVRFQTELAAASSTSKDLGDDPAIADEVDDAGNGDRDEVGYTRRSKRQRITLYT
jgi:hypothetical protein